MVRPWLVLLCLAHLGCATEPGSSSTSTAARQGAALEATPCTLTAPEGWRTLPPTPGVLAAYLEAVDRENVVLRSSLALREPTKGTLEDGIAAARVEEQRLLGQRPGFELVREQVMTDARLPAHLLVYRYNAEPSGKGVLKFHVVYADGFRVLHAVGESQTTYVDALRMPHKEFGLHEFWMRPALASVRCSP